MFTESIQLFKESFSLLRKDKELLLFPTLSGILSIILFVVIFLPAILIFFSGDANSESSSLPLTIAGVVYYLVSFFIITFFNVALSGAANMRINGSDPTVGDGIGIAFSRLKGILGWTVLGGTVGMVLKFLSRQKGIGSFLALIGGAVWGFLSLFVIPIIAIEGHGPITSLKRSSSLIKQVWGESIIGRIGMGLVFALLALIGFIPMVISFFVISTGPAIIVGIGWFVIILLFIGVLSSALNTIFLTALYNYAITNKMPKGFSQNLVEKAFTSRNR
jgi:hypothetical protein